MIEKLDDGSIYAEMDLGLLSVEPEGMSMLVPEPDVLIEVPRDEAMRMLEAAGFEQG